MGPRVKEEHMSKRDVQTLREVFHGALVRYLTVRPRGLQLAPGAPLRTSIEAVILGHGGARSLHESRRPVCRSLDGLRPLAEGRSPSCAECADRLRCVPRVRLDLIVDRRPFRMLLAYTSARAFLVYDAELRQRRQRLEDVLTKITVINSGSWGELRFAAGTDVPAAKRQTLAAVRVGSPTRSGARRLKQRGARQSGLRQSAGRGSTSVTVRVEASQNGSGK